jgi:probable phosphoglycerate mutase
MRPRCEILLREREAGLLRNLTDDLARDVPMYGLWQRQMSDNPFQTRYPGGESIADVADRLRQFRSLLNEHHAGERVLAFCHVGVMRAMRVLLLREDVEQAIATSRLPVPNTGIHIYRPSPSGWTCKCMDPAACADAVNAS